MFDFIYNVFLFRFRLLLGVKSVPDTRTNFEPKMIAFEFKTVFNEKGEPRVTTNWKTQDKWNTEKEIDETDWLDQQSGSEFLSK